MNKAYLLEMQEFDTSIYMADDDKKSENMKVEDDELQNVLEPQLFQGPLIWAVLIFVPIILVLALSIFNAPGEPEPQGGVSEPVQEAVAPKEDDSLRGERYDAGIIRIPNVGSRGR